MKQVILSLDDIISPIDKVDALKFRSEFNGFITFKLDDERAKILLDNSRSIAPPIQYTIESSIIKWNAILKNTGDRWLLECQFSKDAGRKYLRELATFARIRAILTIGSKLNTISFEVNKVQAIPDSINDNLSRAEANKKIIVPNAVDKGILLKKTSISIVPKNIEEYLSQPNQPTHTLLLKIDEIGLRYILENCDKPVLRENIIFEITPLFIGESPSSIFATLRKVDRCWVVNPIFSQSIWHEFITELLPLDEHGINIIATSTKNTFSLSIVQIQRKSEERKAIHSPKQKKKQASPLPKQKKKAHSSSSKQHKTTPSKKEIERAIQEALKAELHGGGWGFSKKKKKHKSKTPAIIPKNKAAQAISTEKKTANKKTSRSSASQLQKTIKKQQTNQKTKQPSKQTKTVRKQTSKPASSSSTEKTVSAKWKGNKPTAYYAYKPRNHDGSKLSLDRYSW